MKTYNPLAMTEHELLDEIKSLEDLRFTGQLTALKAKRLIELKDALNHIRRSANHFHY
jgi:hypothetical protein